MLGFDQVCCIKDWLYSRESLRTWVNKIEIDSGAEPGIMSDHAERPKTLERENKELKRTNEILCKSVEIVVPNCLSLYR